MINKFSLFQANGLGDRSNETENKSRDLLNAARSAFSRTKRDLESQIQNAKIMEIHEVSTLNEKNNATLNRIGK